MQFIILQPSTSSDEKPPCLTNLIKSSLEIREVNLYLRIIEGQGTSLIQIFLGGIIDSPSNTHPSRGLNLSAIDTIGRVSPYHAQYKNAPTKANSAKDSVTTTTLFTIFISLVRFLRFTILFLLLRYFKL